MIAIRRLHKMIVRFNWGYFQLIFIAGLSVLLLAGCSLRENVPGSAVKVAKVDTEYVYEANVSGYVENYRQSRRTRISVFLGFTPNEILMARERAIDDEIRREIKRLPGINISQQQIRELADQQMEELAWRVFEILTQDGADFAALALVYSEGYEARNGGRLDPFPVVDSPEPYQQLAYTMNLGHVSEPFSAWDGWRIIRLDDITEDPLSGPLYHISMIFLKPDAQRAEATIIDECAEDHSIEILDPKYNSRRALVNGDFVEALARAEEAVARREDDELAHYLRARSLWALDRTDEALTELQIAADVGRVSDALVPYYHFYRSEYLEELGLPDEALEAYRASYDAWRQDITLAYDLLSAFDRLGDAEYTSILQDEIEVIAAQDRIVLTFGGHGGGPGGVIMTGEGQHEGSSAEYEPGYR